jgi:hypothetical protein
MQYPKKDNFTFLIMLFDVSLLEMTALLKAYPKVDQYGER